MPTQKGQKLTIRLDSVVRDCFGVHEITVAINGKVYTYPVGSEFIAKKIEKLIKFKHYGKVMNLLRGFKITGFNSFEGGEK